MSAYYPPKIADLVQAGTFTAAQALLPAGDILQSVVSLGLAPGQAANFVTWYCVNHGNSAYYYATLPPSTGIGYDLTAVSLQGVPNPVFVSAYGGDAANFSTQFVVNFAQGSSGTISGTLLPALIPGATSYLVVSGKPVILCASIQFPPPPFTHFGWTAACEGWLVAAPGGSNARAVPIAMGSGGSTLPAIHLHFT